MVKFLALSPLLLTVCINGFSLPDSILERIEDAASSALERNIEHEGTSSLFSADLERSYTGVEDDVPDVHEERWTDLGRPWSRSYSKFRRILKKLLRAQDVDEETVEHTAPQLRTYGCWCTPRGDRDYSNGRGAPRDIIDSDCKGLGACKACIAMKKPECNTIDQNYKFNIMEYLDEEGHQRVDMKCLNEKNGCKWMSCQCDRRFALQLTEKIINGHWNSTFHQKNRWNDDATGNEKFDFDSTCAIRQRSSLIHTPYECCGKLPTWRPFDTQNGRMKCCGKKVYDPEMATCGAEDKLVEMEMEGENENL